VSKVNRSTHAVALVLACSGIAGCNERSLATGTQIQAHLAQSYSAAIPETAQHIFVLHGRVPDDFASRVSAHGGYVVSSLGEIGVIVTRGLSEDDANDIAGSDSVTRDYIGQWIPRGETPQLATSVSPTEGTTNTGSPFEALYLPLQWDMRQIHAPEAWSSGRRGVRDVRVAILDTGLDPDHVDQRGSIDEGRSTAFVSSTSGPPSWADDNLHGTFVGGIVTSNNIGTAGVAPNVTLIAVKVLDAAGTGSIGSVIAGIYYATNVGAQVINLSLGFELPKNAPGAATILSAMNRALNYAHSRGALVVSAAGNEGMDLQHDENVIQLPCEAGPQLCVSATANGDIFASYSNFGTGAIDVAAPGGDGPRSEATWIYGLCSSRAVDPRLAACKDGKQYIFLEGSSAAAPHVSGLAAYLDSQYAGQLSVSQLKAQIRKSADDLGKPGADPQYGDGRINVANALKAPEP